MVGEIALKKLYADNPVSYVIDDINEAQRRFFLAKNVIVIPAWSALTTAAGVINLTSSTYELPGRTNFTLECTAVGNMSAGAVKLQGSLTALAWNDIATSSLALNATTAFYTINSNYPYRYYRLLISTALVGGTSVNITLAAVAP